MNQHLFAVIMAGGKGERFWPAGRLSKPKQLLNLTGNQTMIEETVQRLFPLLKAEHIYVITNALYVEDIRKCLPIPPENIIGEPAGRDTAPCIALAASILLKQDKDATMIVLPSDHLVAPGNVFRKKLQEAAEFAEKGSLITLGIQPTYPATGYGYIHATEKKSKGFCPVEEFKEKPDEKTARMFVEDGGYYWNSGMFIWRADQILAAIQKHVPDLYDRAAGWLRGNDYRLDFQECPKISIDYAVMEKADNIMVGIADFQWDDIGSWGALRNVLGMDDNGNTVKGKTISLDSQNNVLFTDDNTIIAVIGMENTAVVKSGNAVLVCPLKDEQKVKTLVNKLKEQNETDYL